jgi:hypothetical protein
MDRLTFWAIVYIEPTDIDYIEYKIDIDPPDKDYDDAALTLLEGMGYEGSIIAINFSTKEYARQWFIQTCRPDN